MILENGNSEGLGREDEELLPLGDGQWSVVDASPAVGCQV